MWEIFEKLRLEKGVSYYQIAKATGVSTATITNWKQGKYTPKADKLQKIADYFGVSLEYLQTGEIAKPIMIDYQKEIDGNAFYKRMLSYAMLLSENEKLAKTFDKYINLEEKDAVHIDYMINALYNSKHKDTDNDNK